MPTPDQIANYDDRIAHNAVARKRAAELCGGLAISEDTYEFTKVKAFLELQGIHDDTGLSADQVPVGRARRIVDAAIVWAQAVSSTREVHHG